MPESRNEAPASTEGAKIEIRGQKIRTRRPEKRKGIVIFPFKISIRGGGTITDSYDPDDKIELVDKESLTGIGDNIAGVDLWGFTTDGPVDIKTGGIGRTSAHTGQFTILCGTLNFACLIKGHRGDPLLVHPQQLFL